MKLIFTGLILAVCLLARETTAKDTHIDFCPASVKNLFIITIDGFRWQELFSGADSSIINDERYTPDTSTIKSMYWAPSFEERRKRLMPFFWNVLARRGCIYGNRSFGNKMNVANIYSLSYPGYSEMFTGQADIRISSNNKVENPNINVLEYLNSQDDLAGSVAAFTSWNVFPFILNTNRSHVNLNSGYEGVRGDDPLLELEGEVESKAVYNKTGTRQDQLTFVAAKEYVQKFKPSVVYIGFGETDEMAHLGRYDLYLEKAAQIDQMVGDLWHWLQANPAYKDNTTLVITSDHGRGKTSSKWTDHGFFIKGSSETWLALMGPNITTRGEIRSQEQIYLKQLAQTIASLLGKRFQPGVNIAAPIAIR